MKYSFLGVGIIMFGMVGVVTIAMFESITMDNDSEYYVLKEAMKASMFESVDKAYWSDPNNYYNCKTQNGTEVKSMSKVKIVEQKFVENFTRRFAAGIGGDADDYTIEFYDIMEYPPKATVVVKSNTKSYKVVSGEEGFDIVNNLTGILEVDCY